MQASQTLKFRTEEGGGLTIDKKDLVAVVPTADGPSLVIYVEAEHANAELPPKLKFTKCDLKDTQPRKPSGQVHETHIIISTGSGGNLAEKFYDDAVSPVLKALYPDSYSAFHVHKTESEASILDLAKKDFFPKAHSGSALRIILLSGDGGIVDLVNGLLAQPLGTDFVAPQLVILPLGTANALYHSISNGENNTWGLKCLASDSYRQLPLFTVSFSSGSRLLVNEGRTEEEIPKRSQSDTPTLYGAVVCSWGMHATLVADSDTTEFRKFGIDRFKMAAKEALYPADGSPPHAYKARVSILKGGGWNRLDSDEHLYVLATTVSKLEKTFTISPASEPLDGSLRLVHFGPTSGDEAMRIMGLAYQGGDHVGDASVLYEGIDGLRIEFGGREEDARWRRICVDGKIVRVDNDGWVEVLKFPKRVVEVSLLT